MKIIIYEKFLNKIFSSIEKSRPETFGIYTNGYKKGIRSPWSKNEPIESIKSPIDDVDIDYKFEGSKPTVTFDKGRMRISLNSKFQFKRNNQLKDKSQFNLSVIISSTFNHSSHSKDNYKLLHQDILLANLKPIGLRDAISWIFSNQINNSSESDSGIPKTITLIKGKVDLKLSQPLISNKKLTIQGKLT
ncbi:hypothetical protein AADZ86_00885 [Colwelliaceae bacterium BS250]